LSRDLVRSASNPASAVFQPAPGHQVSRLLRSRSRDKPRSHRFCIYPPIVYGPKQKRRPLQVAVFASTRALFSDRSHAPRGSAASDAPRPADGMY
jgi:hypothetical protein